MTDWTESYRPRTLAAIRGNDKARDQLRTWAETWPNEGRAVILHGDPGVGKTSAAHALAADMGWEPLELNASDDRTADVIDRVAGEASASASLTGGRKLVILDEADNLHQHKDRGGAAAMTRVIGDAAQPIVLIANELYDMSRGLRNACETIEFRGVSTGAIVSALRDICRKEDVAFEEEALRSIAEGADGDLRSAINDLQAATGVSGELRQDDVVTSSRDRTTGIFPFLDDVFKEASAREALTSAYDVGETPDDLLFWVEDNVPKDYAGMELAAAYGRLAAGDRWLGRVRATQQYRFWRYATDNLAAGVAAARHSEKGGWTRYGPPSYWRKLGQSRSTRDRRDYIAREIAESAGVSMGTARLEILPFLSRMTHHCGNRELTVSMAAQYDLDADHVAFVTGSGADTNKVEGIVAEATGQGAARVREAAPTGGLAPAGDTSGTAVEMSDPTEATDEPDDEQEDDEDDGDDQAGLADFL